MFKTLKEKAGYVSIETIIIAGLMLALGVAILVQLFAKGEGVATSAIEIIDKVVLDVKDTAPTN